MYIKGSIGLWQARNSHEGGLCYNKLLLVSTVIKTGAARLIDLRRRPQLNRDRLEPKIAEVGVISKKSRNVTEVMGGSSRILSQGRQLLQSTTRVQRQITVSDEYL